MAMVYRDMEVPSRASPDSLRLGTVLKPHYLAKQEDEWQLIRHGHTQRQVTLTSKTKNLHMMKNGTTMRMVGRTERVVTASEAKGRQHANVGAGSHLLKSLSR